jgi:heme-degrading monooxygenase HmoA
MPVTLITAFEVPPDADEAFLADWRRARDCAAATLHRALRADVDFRFVAVARVDSPPAAPDPALPFAAHPGVYEVVREDGRPDVAGGVVLINPFDVPPDADESFLAGWHGARAVLARQQGYLGARLHRSLGPADFRFVDVARWSSPLMFSRALARPEFQAASAGVPFPAHPALYGVVDD